MLGIILGILKIIAFIVLFILAFLILIILLILIAPLSYKTKLLYKENIDILLEIAKTADKASKVEAMNVLKTFSDTRIDEFFEDLAKKKK